MPMNTIKNIRTNVFRESQYAFALIAGVTQGTISRWEKGSREPELEQMKRIREEAMARGIDWNDALFFDVPAVGDQQERNDAPAAAGNNHPEVSRSEERSVGKEGVSTCRSRWSAFNKKKKRDMTGHTKSYRRKY